MDNDLFRKEVTSKIAADGNIDTYVKVLTLRIWLIPLGILIAAAGFVYFRFATGFPVIELFFGINPH